MKKLILIILFSLATLSLNAQQQIPDTPTATRDYQNSVGLRFSDISGYGLSYQRSFMKNYAVKLTGFLYYYDYMRGEGPDYKEEDTNIRYNFGMEIQRNIFKFNSIRGYVLAGAYYDNAEDKFAENGNIANDDFKENFTGGLGFGFEYTLKKHFAVDVELGYKFKSEKGEEFDPNEKIYEPTILKETTLGAGIGLSYYF